MKLCGFDVGLDRPLFLIAGTCVIEGEASALSVAGRLKEITDALAIPLIYKSSFDKANRSSLDSPRGPGLEAGLRILERVKTELGLPVLTDVHEDTPMDEVADVVDVLGCTNGTIVYNLVTDIIQNSYRQPYVAFSPTVSSALKSLKGFNLDRIYRNPQIKKHSDTIRTLFDVLFTLCGCGYRVAF